MNFNSEEFVPKSAVGQIINSAVSRGAAAGENRTLSTLKNSRSRRSSLGL
jgi:pyruvoyl-dependent arginine decarboxylase (PvlArgDC)